MTLAYTKGPAGPINAFVSFSLIFHSILECLYYWKLPRISETIGLIIGTLGIFILIVPEVFNKIWSAIKVVCNKKKKKPLIN